MDLTEVLKKMLQYPKQLQMHVHHQEFQLKQNLVKLEEKKMT